MVRPLISIMILLVMLGVLPAASGQASPACQAIFAVGKGSYDMNGRVNDMDAVPFVENGRIYVPLRYMALSIGVDAGDIVWDQHSRTAILKTSNIVVRLVEGSRALAVEETVYEGGCSSSVHMLSEMDVTPLTRGGRVYLPAKWVAGVFGYEVKWDQKSGCVLIGPPGLVPNPKYLPPPGIKFVGNKNTKKLHLVGCRYAQSIEDTNRKEFKSRDAAVRLGYSPCRFCSP